MEGFNLGVICFNKCARPFSPKGIKTLSCFWTREMATGKMALKITPAMQQYFRIKGQYEDCIVMFRMGDFYEMFFEDAKLASKVLDITLTSRGEYDGKKIPLAGIPYHALEPYLAKFVKASYKVAICEQVEDPKLAKGVVKREVVRVITPGAVIENELLNEKSNNYLMALTLRGDRIGLALADISTAEFLTTELHRRELRTLLAQFSPAEIIVPLSLGVDKELFAELGDASYLSPLEDAQFAGERAEGVLREHFKVASLDGFGLANRDLAVSAAGALLTYLVDTQKQNLDFLNTLRYFSTKEFMVLDEVTLSNLEVLRNIRDGSLKGTLLEVLDRTRTAMGARLLRKWLCQPLMDIAGIHARSDAVEELTKKALVRGELATLLKRAADIERLQSKVMVGRAKPRDLAALRDTLILLPAIKQELVKCVSAKLNSLASFDTLEPLAKLLRSAVKAEPATTLLDGGVIREGYNGELDELREAKSKGKVLLKELEQREKDTHGIRNLRVRYNRILGYYIEVSKSNLLKVPEHYIRKQTLTNGERYFTEELKQLESKVLHAEERIVRLEQRLFEELVAKIAENISQVQDVGHMLSQVDVFCSFAEAALRNRYVKPVLDDSQQLDIRAGRHPVVERHNNEFIPNDCVLDASEMVILTGPNMAGKSTYMRQIALICLMAQIGSFVPAESATLGLVDRIFTRVGAFDDLAHGQSTFMVEMSQTANILHHATARSLIILDEIGRGTSTFDGVSIAWSVAEYIYNHLKAKTLFATHYHVLNKLADKFERVRNFHILVKDEGGRIVFLRKIIEGGTDKSYGIHVAKLAGMPHEVIERARQIQDKLTAEDKMLRKLNVKTHEKQKSLLDM